MAHDPYTDQPPEAGTDGPGGSETDAPSGAAGAGFFSRIHGALEGTVTVRSGTDLTAPVDAEWEAGR